MHLLATTGSDATSSFGIWISIIAGIITVAGGLKAFVFLPREVADLKDKNSDIQKQINKIQEGLKSDLEELAAQMKQDGLERETRLKVDMARLEAKLDLGSRSQASDHDLLTSIKTTLDILRRDVGKNL